VNMKPTKQDSQLSKSAQAVQTALNALGVSYVVQELPSSTRTAQDAANSIGCELSQIVKSLLFCSQTKHPILVLTSGSNRVDTQKIANLVGESVAKADADFTRRVTGFAIGGIPPLRDHPYGGNPSISHVFIDEDLLKFTSCWAAAGTPNAVFCLTTNDLITLSGGKVVDIKST